MMDLPDFEDLMDRHGGDLSAWPAASRREAERLIGASDEARAIWGALGEVEALLRASRGLYTGPVDQIAAVAMRHRQRGRLRAYTMRTGWGVAGALALFLGYYVGDIAPREHEESATQLMALALDAPGSADVD